MKVSVVGFGKAGNSLLPALTQDPDIAQVDIYDPKFSNLGNPLLGDARFSFLSSDFTFDEEYDLLVISTPDNLHAKMLIRALDEGIDTFVEKPAVYKKSESQELLRCFSNPSRGRFTTNTIMRASPHIQYFREQILNRRLGDYLYFEGKYIYGRWEKITNGWRGTIPDYSVILGGGIHMIDLVCYLVDDFHGSCVNFRYQNHSKESVPVKDTAISLLTLSKGHKANISCIFASPTPHERHLDCYGEKAWFQYREDQIRFHESFKSASLGARSSRQIDKSVLLKEFLASKKAGWPKNIEHLYPTEDEVIHVLDFCLS